VTGKARSPRVRREQIASGVPGAMALPDQTSMLQRPVEQLREERAEGG